MGGKATTITTVIHLKGKGIKDLGEVKNLKLLPLFTRLQCIYLQSNKISTIPASVCNLLATAPRLQEFLQEVNLSNNKLLALPDEFFCLINLRRLYLDHNKLVEFPKGILSFYRLEILSIRHNSIQHLPWHLNRLRELTVLRFDHNKIGYIPNTVTKLLKLNDLQALPNPLEDESLMMFYSGDLDVVLEYLSRQKIPGDYPYMEDYQRALQQKRENLERMTEDQRMVKKVLKDKQGYALFEEYMEKEHSQENIMFWKKIYEFSKKFGSDREITTEELITEAKAIYEEFIASESKYTINLPGGVTETLVKIFTDPFVYPKGINQWVFQQANKAIIDLISRDTFKRFKCSPEGIEIIKKLQADGESGNRPRRQSLLLTPPRPTENFQLVISSTTASGSGSESSRGGAGGGRRSANSRTNSTSSTSCGKKT